MESMLLLQFLLMANFLPSIYPAQELIVRAVQKPSVQLIIYPPLNGKNVRVEKTGSEFILSCYLLSNSGVMPRNLQINWLTEYNEVISNSPGSSVYSKTFPNDTNILYFNNGNFRGEETYKCLAKFDGQMLQRDVRIAVIDGLQFRDSRTKMGALVGESLQVDCGAEGSPTPAVTVASSGIVPLNDYRFTFNDRTLVISELRTEDDNTDIICSATQFLPEYNYTNKETKTINIEVYYRPEFSSKYVKQYARLNKNSGLICHVTRSNPPVISFNFSKNGKNVDISDRKYSLKINQGTQKAVLQIAHITEEDFGHYQCTANNGKSHNTLTIKLEKMKSSASTILISKLLAPFIVLFIFIALFYIP